MNLRCDLSEVICRSVLSFGCLLTRNLYEPFISLHNWEETVRRRCGFQTQTNAHRSNHSRPIKNTKMVSVASFIERNWNSTSQKASTPFGNVSFSCLFVAQIKTFILVVYLMLTIITKKIPKILRPSLSILISVLNFDGNFLPLSPFIYVTRAPKTQCAGSLLKPFRWKRHASGKLLRAGKNQKGLFYFSFVFRYSVSS